MTNVLRPISTTGNQTITSKTLLFSGALRIPAATSYSVTTVEAATTTGASAPGADRRRGREDLDISGKLPRERVPAADRDGSPVQEYPRVPADRTWEDPHRGGGDVQLLSMVSEGKAVESVVGIRKMSQISVDDARSSWLKR